MDLLELENPVLEKVKQVREKASELGIPQIGLMTHIDSACGEINKDLKNVYRSKYLQNRMKDFSSAVGIPVNCIFPIKNYSHEIEMNNDVDILILSALRKIIDFGDDFIEKF
ncbi:interferon-induced protein 44-like [Cyprinodon tularosa]|uniref:interferon-induced protein 44-like n=1 Tax=Cyprinodon tularosa TaxID=77115 RepID=UPI0018E20BCB|nr:interferon-induced protein 44-like [Cyprinodon tularosa]